MSTNLTDAFESFHQSICLTDTQSSRIESARKSLTDYLKSHFNLGDEAVFLQGSYANGTAVKPLPGGEYDVDIVAITADSSTTADVALDEIWDALEQHGTYKDRLISKKPCIRVEYADDHIGGIHVDIVPVRKSAEWDAPLDAPRRGDGWHSTAPSEYTQWCANQGDLFRRSIRMLKRWRDEQQEVKSAIKSIVLQVLASRHIAKIADDATRMAYVFGSLHEELKDLSEPPELLNPVLPSENLAARWTKTAFLDFKREVKEAAELAKTATDTDDLVEASEAWRTIFGDAFPLPVRKSIDSMQLADTSHAELPATRGWYEAIDPSYRVSIKCQEGRGHKGKMSSYENDGRLLFSGKQLKFKSDIQASTGIDVWWRVTNTGKHARDVDGLRGGFIKAKNPKGGPSTDPTVNWESTSYTGSHLVEAFLLRGERIVAKSEPFIVNIHRTGYPWHW